MSSTRSMSTAAGNGARYQVTYALPRLLHFAFVCVLFKLLCRLTRDLTLPVAMPVEGAITSLSHSAHSTDCQREYEWQIAVPRSGSTRHA